MSSRNFRQYLLRILSYGAMLATVIFSLAIEMNSQDIFGRISGTVTDASGAVVPNAKVTLVNEDTQTHRDITADRNGFYAADDMAVGTYSVTAGKSGFKTTEKKGNVVHAGARVTVDLKLEIGAVTETVEVAATAESVNTTSGEVATTITQNQIENLALNQRHYESLVSLVPGAALEASGTNPAALTINYNNSVADTNGQRIDGQNWSVDGGFNLDSGSNNSVFNQVGVDFISEVTVQTSNYDAEFGRSASSTINVVTKSGTTHYHGSLFEYVQNNIFNAENSGTKLTAPTATGYLAVPPFHFNDFGWSFGGPAPFILKDKLFFFAGQEFKKFRGVYPGLTTATQGQTFPTASEAQGNFVDLLPPAGSTKGITLTTPAVIPASCGGVLYTAPNVINPSCITGDGAAMAALYTQAAKLSLQGGLPTSTSANNVTFNLPNPLNLREDIARIDYHPSDKHSLYFRYLHDSVDIYNPFSTFGGTPAVPVDPDLRHRPGFNFQLGWVDLISPTLINEAKFNADWHSQRTPPQGTAYLTTTYGFKFIPPLGQPAQFPTGLPQITWTCNASCSSFPTATPTTVNGPGIDFLEAPTTDINPVDNVTWQKGNHSFKFGGEFARNRKTQNSRVAYTGTVNFANTAGAKSGSNSTGDPFADALLGNFNSLSQVSQDTVGQFRFNDVETYFQDTWKATSKLSLVLGLRFIYTTPTYTTGNNMTNFDPFAFNVANEPTFTSAGSGSNISLASPGLCSGPLTTVTGSPVLTIECNGLVRPGQVPASQAKSVPAFIADPTLVNAIPATAPRGFFPSEYLPAPRIGFSYSPFDDNKTVLRGGFGIFYDKPEGNLLGQGINSQGYVPWAQTVTINGVNDSLSQFDSAAGVAPVPAPSTVGLNGTNPNLVVARTYEYSFGVEHELPSDTLLRINYVGNLGRHILRGPSVNVPSWTTQQGFLPTSVNPNTYACPSGINAAAYGCTGGFANSNINGDQIRPFLGYSSIGFELSDANSNYNALQASVTKRAGFLSGTFAYTWSKVLGDGGGAADAYNENPESECPFTCLVSTAANPVLVNGLTTAAKGGTQTGGVVETWQQFDYGRLSFDHTQIVAMAFTLEQPFGRDLHGVAGAAVKGWSLSGIMHYQTGAYLTATAGSAVGTTSISATRRGNTAAGQPVLFTGECPPDSKGNPQKAICWVNPSAFSAASNLGAGDAPIGNIVGPDFYQWDMSLRKQFGLPVESMKLQFQADAFNVFNHTNWNNPTVNNAGAASFGQITTSLPARVLQFGAKFVF
jgi:hypothetical protein